MIAQCCQRKVMHTVPGWGIVRGMENVAVHLPRQLVEQIDEAARDEMRSRSNLVRVLVSEGLRRRESAAQDEGSQDA